MRRPWKRTKSYRRSVAQRTIRTRILIVCEGQKTEPNYFRKFPLDTEVVELVVDGTGMSTLSLVDKAMELVDKASSQKCPYNQAWCVFDKDSFPLNLFNQAILKARNNEIHVAYSNECFELWYYLHFQFTDTAFHRSQYAHKLTREMNQKYVKNSPDMYDLLKNNQDDAIRNSKKLLNRYGKCIPARDNPSTTVHELVATLNSFIEDES